VDPETITGICILGPMVLCCLYMLLKVLVGVFMAGESGLNQNLNGHGPTPWD
jgi:hypothetical protein